MSPSLQPKKGWINSRFGWGWVSKCKQEKESCQTNRLAKMGKYCSKRDIYSGSQIGYDEDNGPFTDNRFKPKGAGGRKVRVVGHFYFIFQRGHA